MIRTTRETLGPLTCHVVQRGGAAQRLGVVLCHGFGAPGNDLVPLAGELLRALPPPVAEQIVFVFPEAPLSLADQGMPGGRAWWPIDILRLQMAIAQGNFRDLRNDRPPQLPPAREKLEQTIDAVRAKFGLGWPQLVLGGFSQGSMIATDIALRAPEPPAALVIYSGTLLCEAEWKELAAARRGMKVIQSHGRQDQILPFAASEWLRDMLVTAGLDVEFLPFMGPHTISSAALTTTAKLLAALVEAKPDAGA